MSDKTRSAAGRRLLAIALLSLCTACGSQDSGTRPDSPGAPERPDRSGYIADGGYLDAIPIVPPPPDAGSPGRALDDHVSREYLGLIGTPRWDQATRDARLRYPDAASEFSCAAGIRLTQADAPATNKVLVRSMLDVARTVRPVKKRYQRTRPFMENGRPVCTPTGKRYLAKDGSFPSGHAATGWAWALILAEIRPEAAGRIFRRGWAFGESRAICNVHWQSDVSQARTVAALVVAQLHGIEAFRADLEAARAEMAELSARNQQTDLDCRQK